MASHVQIRSFVRRKRRRAEEAGEGHGINIYPMMDMMTILLVFMIMQLAATTADAMPTPELQIPETLSNDTVDEAISVQISRNEITVDGQHCIDLQNGAVDDRHTQGANNFLVAPLLDVMAQHRTRQRRIAAENPRYPFTGEVRIIADRRTPFRTLAEVSYTLGQAEYPNVRFVLLRRSE